MRTIKAKTEGLKIRAEIFNSPGEFVRTVGARETIFGGDNWRNTVANDFIASRVDISSVRKVQSAVNKSVTQEKTVRKTYNDVVGYMPNVPRYVMGLPDNMRAEKRVVHKSKIVNVYIDCTVPWYVGSDELEEACTRLVEEVLGLEKGGYRVNLTAMFTSAMSGELAFVGVKIKGANEPLNLARVLFPFVRANDFVRKLCFAWYERTKVKHEYGYGTCVSYKYSHKMALIEYLKRENGVLVLVEDYRRGGIHIADSIRKENR